MNVTSLINSIDPIGSNATNETNSQSVIEFDEQVPDMGDLFEFAQQTNEAFTNISKFLGPTNEEGDDSEATLDVEYLTALGSGAFTWYITIEVFNYCAFYFFLFKSLFLL